MGVPGTVVRASANSGIRRLRKETHDLYWFRPSTWSSNNLTSSFGVSLFALYCFEYRVCVLFLQWVPSPALYSPGAERRCLCPIRIQGQSPKLRFGRLSLYSLSWSFSFARCFAPRSSWRLGCKPYFQGLPPCSMVYGGPIGFSIDKPPSIS